MAPSVVAFSQRLLLLVLVVVVVVLRGGGALFMARSVVSETVCGHKELSAPTRVSAMFSSHTSTELPNCDAPAESH